MQSLIGNNRRADISFFPNGRIDISARLSRLLSLQSGDTIDIKFDGYEYYIYVRNRSPFGGRFEAQCFPSNKKGRHFRAYSRRLYAAVSRACHADGCLRIAAGEVRTICDTTHVSLITLAYHD